MVYNRGNRRHFDEWDHYYGCRGWNYNNVLKYFLRSENNTDQSYLKLNPGYHNTSGPITVSSDWSHLNVLPIFGEFIETTQTAGFKLVDINGIQNLFMLLIRIQSMNALF
jgi:choline dehydrogenase